MQISEGLDSTDAAAGQKLISDAQSKLSDIVGADKADETVKMMTSWSKQLNVPTTAFDQKSWDIATLLTNVRGATSQSVSTDPVFDVVVNKVKKYQRHKAMLITGSVVESTCAVASLLAPGMMIPVGVELFNGSFVASTGGCESTKLVNELYLAKSMESRWKRLNEESQLAMTGYQSGLQKKSPTLMACSESILCQLVGAQNTKKILGQLILPDDQAAEATALAAKDNSASADDAARRLR